jgi:hypothetical protein
MNIGDRVAYSANFLRSTGQVVGEAGFQRGTIVEFEPLGSITLARVKWDNPDWNFFITSVNVANLAKVGTAAMNAN